MIKPLQRRLKGIEEFEMPAFVGRMGREERRRKLLWWVMVLVALIVGAGIGLVYF